MSKFRLELNSEGVRELLRSQEMTSYCEELAQEVAGRYGDDCKTSTHVGPNRVNVSVYSDRQNNGLMKALR